MDGKLLQLQKVLLLEKDIEKLRVELAKEYILSQGYNPKSLTDADLLAIYSMLVIKAEKNCKVLVDKIGQSMV